MNEDQLPPGITDFIPAIPPDRLALYKSELADIDATDEQKLELLEVIYSIMRSFVELGFDVGKADIAHLLFNEEAAKSSEESS